MRAFGRRWRGDWAGESRLTPGAVTDQSSLTPFFCVADIELHCCIAFSLFGNLAGYGARHSGHM